MSVAALIAVLTLPPRMHDEASSGASPGALPLASAATALDSPSVATQPVQSPLDRGVGDSSTRKSQPVLSKSESAAAAVPKTPKPVQPPTDDEALKVPLERMSAAATRGELALADAAPSLSPAQKETFQRVYSRGESIHSTSQIGQAIVSGNHAEVPFTLTLTYVDKTAKTLSSVRIEYLAVLERHGTRWDISELRSR
jgi:hypothetical protein